MKSEELSIVSLRVENVLGCELCELTDVGQLTTITGRNGSGKSSILKAIALAFSGSKSSPELLRQGAEEGEVFLKLSDGMEIRRKVTAKGAGAAEVTEPKYKGKIQKAESYLSKLLDALALDPVAFVTAAPKDQVRILLETFPVEATNEEIASAVGTVEIKARSKWDLCEVDAVVAQLREQRTMANGAKKRAETTAQEMSLTYDAEAVSTDWKAEEAKLQKKSREMFLDKGAKLELVRKSHVAAMHGLRAQEAEELQAVKDRWKSAYVDEVAAASRGEAGVTSEFAPIEESLTAELATVQEKARTAAQAIAAHNLAEKMKADLKGLAADWNRLERAVKGFEDLKRTMAGRIPIEGLTVEDGTVRVKDQVGRWVPLGQLNTAEQIRVAVRLAAHRSGALRTVLADGLERLDEETRKAFLSEAKALGCQWIVAWADSSNGDGVRVEVEA